MEEIIEQIQTPQSEVGSFNPLGTFEEYTADKYTPSALVVNPTAMISTAFSDILKKSQQVTNQSINKSVIPESTSGGVEIENPYQAIDDLSKMYGVTGENKSEVDLSNYSRLSDGSYIPRHNYTVEGVNNDYLESLTQSTSSKFYNGAYKAGMNTLRVVAGGTAGLIYGIGNAISEGNFAALYDNDFTDLMDDWAIKERIDMPNYKSYKEVEGDFLDRVLNVNFIADDVMQGLSYLSGTIITEGIWAAATGGTSLIASASRAGLKAANRAALRGISKQGIKATSKQFLKNTKNIYKAYQRANKAGRMAQNLHNVRFLATSPTFEAMQESKGALNESIEAFETNFIEGNGRPPTINEYQRFMDDAVISANTNFLVNWAVIGASNIAILGKSMGVNLGVSKHLKDFKNRTLGLGFTPMDKFGKVTVRKANIIQKAIGNTSDVIYKPLTEAAEESIQGISSGTMQQWLDAKHNPKALNKTLSVMDALKNSVVDAATTAEGQKEAFLGFLIGIVGGGVTDFRTRGKLTPLGIGKYKVNRQFYEKNVDNYNQANAEYFKTYADPKLVDRFTKGVAIETLTEEAMDKANNDMPITATLTNKVASFQNLGLRESMDTLNDFTADLESHFDTYTESQIEEMGLDKDTFKTFKENAIENAKQEVETYKEANEFASTAIQKMRNIKGMKDSKLRDIQEAMALNIFLGKNVDAQLKQHESILKSFIKEEDLYNSEGGFRDIIEEESFTKIRELDKEIHEVDGEIARVEAKYAAIRLNIGAETATSTNQKSKAEGEVTKLDELKQREAILIQNLNNLRDKHAKLQGARKVNLDGLLEESEALTGEKLSEEDIDKSIRQLSKIYEVLESYDIRLKNGDLSETTKKSLESRKRDLETVLAEHRSLSKVYKDYQNIYIAMTDPKFLKDNNKGIANIIYSEGFDTNDRYVKDEDIDPRTLDIIEKKGKHLTDSQKYTLKVYAKILESKDLNFDMKVEETITQDIMDMIENREEVPEGIIDTIVSKMRRSQFHLMSKNEKEIYERFVSYAQADYRVKNLKKELQEWKEKFDKDTITEEEYNAKKEEIEANIEEVAEDFNFEYEYSLIVGGLQKTPYNFNKNDIFSGETVEEMYPNLINKKYEDVATVNPLNEDSTLEEILRHHITKVLNNVSHLRALSTPFDNIEDVTQFAIPSKKEIEAFRDRIEGKKNVKLTDADFDTLNRWATALGVTTEISVTDKDGNTTQEKISFLDLIKQYQAAVEGEAQVDTTLGKITNVGHYFTEIDQKNNRLYSYAQSYDKALVTTNGSDVRMSNISLKGVLSYVQGWEILSISKSKSSKSGVSIAKFDQKTNSEYFVHVRGVNGELKYIRVRTDAYNNIILHEKSAAFLSEISGLEYSPKTPTVSKYFSLMVSKADENGNTYTQSVNSDFTFAQRKTMNTEAIYKLKKGDNLQAVVDFTDPYNADLIEQIAKAETKEKVDHLKSKFYHTATVYLFTSEREFVGVLKANEVNPTKEQSKSGAAVLNIRREAIRRAENKDTKPINVKVDHVLMGRPNVELVEGEVRQVAFDTRNLQQVKGAGYVINGRVQSASKDFVQHPYLTKIKSDSTYKNKRVPFVIVNMNGQNVAYPMTLKPTQTNILAEFNEILEKHTNASELMSDINNLLIENGLPLTTYGVFLNNYQSKIEELKTSLEDAKIYPDIKFLKDGNIKTIKEFVKENATLNINITHQPTHSPKINLDLDSVNIKPIKKEATVIDAKNLEEGVSSKKQEIEDKQDENC